MATRNLAYRIGVEGKAEFVSAQDEMATASERVWQRSSAAAERASATATAAVEKARRLAAEAALAQPSPVAQRVTELASAGSHAGVQGPVFDDTSTKSARASAAAFAVALEDEERRVRSLKAAIDPLWAAQQRLATETANADQLLKRGAITVQEHAAAVALATKGYTQAEASVKRMGAATGFASYELKNLSFQLNDVVSGLAMGQRPMQVLMQQGGQIAQILGGNPRALGGALRALIGPQALVIGGFVAMTAATLGVVMAADAAATSQAKLAQTLRFTAAASGATVGDIRNVALAQAALGDISVKTAAEVATTLATVGQVSARELPIATDTVKHLAFALGTDMPTAAKLFAESLADPIKGVDQLNERLHFLTVAQVEHIVQLQRQGDKEAAVNELIRQTSAAVVDADQHLGAIAGTFHFLHLSIDEAADSFAEWSRKLLGFQSGDAATELVEAKTKLAKLQKGAALFPGLDFWPQIAEQQQRVSEAQFKIQADAERTEQANRSTASKALRGAFDGLSPTDGQIKALQDKQVAIRAALKNPDPAKSAQALADAGITRGQAQAALVEGDAQIKQLRERALHRDRHAESLGREAAAMAANARAALDVAAAYLVSDADGEKAEARRKALTDATRKGIDADAQGRRQLALQYADDAAQGAKAARAVLDQSAALDSLNAQVASGAITSDEAARSLQLETQLRTLNADAARAEGATKQALLDDIKALTEGYSRMTAAQARSNLLSAGAAANDRIAKLRLEADLAGDVTGKRELMAAALKTEQSADFRASDDDRAKATAVINAMAEAQTQIDLRHRQFVTGTARDQENQLKLATAELGLVGKSADEHDRVINRLQRELDLKGNGLQLSEDEIRTILAQGDAIDAVNRQVQAANDNWNELRQVGESFIDTVLNPQNWNDFGDLGKKVILDLVFEFEKLAAINPLKNWLFGEQLPTLGGVIGVLGGNKTKAAEQAGLGLPAKEAIKPPAGTAFDPIWVQTVGGGLAGGAPWDEIQRAAPRDLFDILGMGGEAGSDLAFPTDALKDWSGDFTFDLGQVFDRNTRGGFVGALTQALAAGGQGGGGGGGLLSMILKAATSAVTGGGSGFSFTGGPDIGSSFDFTPGFAAGTDSAPGGMAYVHKDELLTYLPKGAQVFSAAETRRMMRGAGGQGGGVHVQLGDFIIHAEGAGPRETDALRHEIAELRASLPSTIIGTMNDARERGRAA